MTPARGEPIFLEGREGDSVVLPCQLEPRSPPPFGVYLKRKWLSHAEVLFMHTGSDFTVGRDEDRARIAVSGDPHSLAVNVTLSQLTAADTDRYFCEFLVEVPFSEDLKLPGTNEFFLLVGGGGGGGSGGGGESISFFSLQKKVSHFPLRLPQSRWTASTPSVTIFKAKSFAPIQV